MKKTTLLFFSLISLFSFSQSVANYSISVTTIWNAASHTSVPTNSHWSPLVGATHKNPNDVLQFNAIAPLTNGIKDIAEIGNSTNFQNEVNTLINDGKANQYLEQNFSPFAGNNSNASISNISVSEAFPYITLVSMVAPSPDWFIAVNSELLRSGNNSVNNGWKDTYTLDVYAYDAGTDDGIDYTSPNSVSSPRTNITKIDGFPVNGNKMATITFTYNTSTLGVDDLNPLENVEVFPNPTHGLITINNIQNKAIASIRIYNILGALVKDIRTKPGVSKLNINLSTLSKGMYVLSINTSNGAIKTKKLVIN